MPSSGVSPVEFFIDPWEVWALGTSCLIIKLSPIKLLIQKKCNFASSFVSFCLKKDQSKFWPVFWSIPSRGRDAASSSQRGPGRGRVASARRRVGAGGARPRLRRWCASFSSPRSRRADPRLAPTKNNRRQRHGPAKRQRRGSAADAKSPLRLLLMGRVEPPDCHDQEPFKELKIPHLN